MQRDLMSRVKPFSMQSLVTESPPLTYVQSSNFTTRHEFLHSRENWTRADVLGDRRTTNGAGMR